MDPYAPPAGPWIVRGDPGPVPPRSEIIGALLLMAAGACGLLQLFLPWRSGLDGTPATSAGSVSGLTLFRLMHAVPAPSLDVRIAIFAVLGAAIGGGVLVGLGTAMLAPINHRPLGAAAVTVGALCLLGASWLLIRSSTLFGASPSQMFSGAQAGFFVFLATGLVGVAGGLRALAVG